MSPLCFVYRSLSWSLKIQHSKGIDTGWRQSRISEKAPLQTCISRIRSDMGTATGATHISSAKLWATLNLDSATLLSAKFLSSAEEVYAIWGQRDVVSSRKRAFSTTYSVSKDNQFIASPPVELRDSPSHNIHLAPSRKKYLKFTSPKQGNGEFENVTVVELWTMGSGLESCWEVDPATHGSVYTDSTFGSVTWAPDESMVAYIADRPEPDQSADSDDPEESWISSLTNKFHENARDPFGEGYINKRSPVLCIADLAKGQSYVVCPPAGPTEDQFLGEPQWSPDGKFIAATVRRASFVDADMRPESDEFLPDDLGLRYCYNRYSAIVMIRAPQSPNVLKSDSLAMLVISSEEDPADFCCFSPRFSPDGKELIYLSAPRFGRERSEGKVLPHDTTKVLRYVRIGAEGVSKPCTLIPVPEGPSSTDFPGLYLYSLIENPWLDADSIVFSSAWGSVSKLLFAKFTRKDQRLVPNANSIVSPLCSALEQVQLEENGTTASSAYSRSVLDNFGNALLISASNPANPTQLFVLHLENANGVEKHMQMVAPLSLRAKALRTNLRDAHTVDLVTTGVCDENFSGSATRFIPAEHESSLRFQVTVLLPQTVESKSPFIVYPHGGPHTVTMNGYSQGTMALLKRGFAVMYVNYRGSLGLGQKSLETLPGNIGRQDVNEVVQATRWALSEPDFRLDQDRVGFLGGSHSGFLGAHTSLIPGLYKRTVLRNPVTNIATMFGATDIPDWCFCEVGLKSKNENGVQLAPAVEELRMMYECSPVSRVRPCAADQRPGPTLLQVGGSDRRVPPQQSLEWKRIMTQAYGSSSVSIRWYPNSGHAIDEVPNGDDAIVHALDFLSQI